jgi:glutamate formiminotransferase/formiminotetrahydrofolate cyclodeaminase
MGAFLNVKVNAAGLKDKNFVKDILKKGNEIEKEAKKLEAELLTMVNSKIS